MKRNITIVGIGMGNPETMTLQAIHAVEQSDLLIGAQRMLDSFQDMQKPTFCAYQPEKIKDYLIQNTNYQKPVILLSGDIGFYSGAKKLYQVLEDYQIDTISGISSLVYLCGKLHTAWEDVHCVSIHGREAVLISEIASHQKTFILAGGNQTPAQICRQLLQKGLGTATVSIGENLSYPNEKIVCDRAENLITYQSEKLCVMLVTHQNAHRYSLGIADEQFIRDKVPMTKSEVRTVSIAKLQLQPDDIVYDIGAGTGSVSVELALQLPSGMVYAVERKPQALELMIKNQKQFGAYNLECILGEAPEVLKELPKPDKAFLGGTAGNMEEILRLLLQKNPYIRIVVNVIALESLTEALKCFQKFGLIHQEVVQMTIAKAKEVGSYHMMMGQNPVYVLSGEGNGYECP